MLTAVVAITAFAIDLGYLCTARTELQRSADSAAIAATWRLIDPENLVMSDDMSAATAAAKSTAAQFAALNPVGSANPALTDDDVKVGYLSDPSNPDLPMDYSDPNRVNAVQVRVRRNTDLNGNVPYFFAPVMGSDSQGTEAWATAAVLTAFQGFQAPESGENLDFLPFALDKETWDNMMAGGGDDDWYWDPETKSIVSGSDGVREINLYPQGTGSPGNRGTVDVGSNNNSTADIARQIVHGVSASDLAYHGGKLELNSDGLLFLNGDTGISAGIKDELLSIKGKPRIIPIFSTVVGPGNNATYTIVAFVGIRILDVKLTGSMNSKRVTIQPAKVVTKGGIPSTTGGYQSQYVYSNVWLVR
jgi:hypothetical protein